MLCFRGFSYAFMQINKISYKMETNICGLSFLCTAWKMLVRRSTHNQQTKLVLQILQLFQIKQLLNLFVCM